MTNDQRRIVEMKRYLPVLQRAQDSPYWAELTAGTGIATTNGYEHAANLPGDGKPPGDWVWCPRTNEWRPSWMEPVE